MKQTVLLLAAVLPFLLTSCASTPTYPAYHSEGSSALIVKSLDGSTCQVLAPNAVDREDDTRLLDQAKNFSSHDTAVIILENYSEPELGKEFRDRSFGWFLGLRGLGYQHIFFLRGGGGSDPNGLPTLARYD